MATRKLGKLKNQTNANQAKKDDADTCITPNRSQPTEGLVGKESDQGKNTISCLEETPSPKKKTFADAVGDNMMLNLEFVEGLEINAQKIATMMGDDVIQANGSWDSAIICCILGANPPLEVVKGFVHRISRNYEIDDVILLKEAQFIILFNKKEDKNEVIKRKYYQFDNKPMLVMEWSPGLKFEPNELQDIPIWIQFPSLNIKYWSTSGLSKLGSLIGRPIKRDNATATRTKLEYARIQVEVHAKQEFPKEINYMDEYGRLITQEIVYEWKPSLCNHCKKLGHEEETCKKKNQKPVQRRIVWKRAQEKMQKEEKDISNEGEIEDGNQEAFQNVSGRKAARRSPTTKERRYGDLNKYREFREAQQEGHQPHLHVRCLEC
ncbi:unnamed protein product [Cuscuta campestris]|uniref:DUF4283 domain-containing protein n=1 Tax=Cuscuta campestris TaxID=132261 RepID=A0A484K9D4_9ASTE|nr:unnamed protein product [Cuscuta campestris]